MVGAVKSEMVDISLWVSCLMFFVLGVLVGLTLTGMQEIACSGFT